MIQIPASYILVPIMIGYMRHQKPINKYMSNAITFYFSKK